VYQVESDDNAGYQVAKLPEDALAAYASLIDLIALHPGAGQVSGGRTAGSGSEVGAAGSVVGWDHEVS
jgi:hypothetical protein